MSKLTKIQLVQANTVLANDNAALRAQLATAQLDLAIARADIVALADVASAMNTVHAAPAPSTQVDTSTREGQLAFFAAKRAERLAAANPTPTAQGDKVVAPAGFWDHKKAQAESRGTTVAAPYQRKAFARTPEQEAARNAAMATGKTVAVA